ncbi:MAG TPA: hypothetical protein PLX96_07050 [Candidatus Omnitrophota bacterium]|nr:hypothetical protein [Candidatus Omnitrophota bacterium]
MTKKWCFLMLIAVLSAGNVAAIRRAEDPIRDTQTSPIAFQQKMEEEKDGKKGPLLYHVRYNPKDSFLTTSPVLPEEKAKENLVSPYSKTEELDWWEEPDLSAGSNAGVHSGQDWDKMEEDYWSGDVSAKNGEMGSGAGNEIKENADSASSQAEDEWW